MPSQRLGDAEIGEHPISKDSFLIPASLMVWRRPLLQRRHDVGQEERFEVLIDTEGDGPMIKMKVLAIDWAKSVFQLHAVVARRVVELRQQVKRKQLLQLL